MPEVAVRLGVAERTVRRWIAAGELPAHRDGRAFAIRLRDALRVHEQSRVAPTSKRIELLHEVEETTAGLVSRVALLERALADAVLRIDQLEQTHRREAA
ncbi:MAG: helix-turn-helix domain-containing protein [Actinobacteria bacterium]|nr:MAG: helix-turn-helix domain-containing protein [Actinomycetota bacterium]